MHCSATSFLGVMSEHLFMSYLIAALKSKDARQKRKQSQCEDSWQNTIQKYQQGFKMLLLFIVCIFVCIVVYGNASSANSRNTHHCTYRRCQGHLYAGTFPCINYPQNSIVHNSNKPLQLLQSTDILNELCID